jgi:hypothetical protein
MHPQLCCSVTHDWKTCACVKLGEDINKVIDCSLKCATPFLPFALRCQACWVTALVTAGLCRESCSRYEAKRYSGPLRFAGHSTGKNL